MKTAPTLLINTPMPDFNSDEEAKNTMALLKLLELGRQQIEAAQFKPAREVFRKMDVEILG
jgi:hypothetical protein